MYSGIRKTNVHHLQICSGRKFKNKDESTEKYFYQSALLNLEVYMRNNINGASGSSIYVQYYKPQSP